MSRFVRIIKPRPVEQFISDVLESRAPLEEAYLNAWSATKRANTLMSDVHFAHFQGIEQANKFGIGWRDNPGGSVTQDVIVLQREAQIEDRRADMQAMAVINCADKWLRRLGFALVGGKRVEKGFGALYNGVHLTSLLWAAMNCERHAWEWDDDKNLEVPYVSALTKGKRAQMALPSIGILQRALGVGLHDRIHNAPCWAVLKVIDGKFGTHEPDYGRFEGAIIAAAGEIVAEERPADLPLFCNELAWSAPVTS
jgi:hypothetical protein